MDPHKPNNIQVMGLHSAGISAAFLGSSQKQPARVLQSLEDGEVNVLYVTPEFIVSSAAQLTSRLTDLNKVCLGNQIFNKVHKDIFTFSSLESDFADVFIFSL